MNTAAELTLEARTETRNKVKAIRRDGFVPTNIVSRGKESVMGKVDYNTLVKVLNEVGYTQPVTLKLDGEEYTTLVTDIKFVSAKNTLEHVTFQEVKKGEQVTANVPVVLVGDAPATAQGNIILQLLDSVEIQTGALSIPEKFEVDISDLKEDGDTIGVDSIVLPEGAVLMTEETEALVKAEAPRVAEEPEEAEEGEDAEGAEAGEDAGKSSEESAEE